MEVMDFNRSCQLMLSRVLDDIGLTTISIQKRRRTWLMKEAMNTVKFSLQHVNNVDRLLDSIRYKKYHFGSQSEATTTLHMGSDIDSLYCFENTSKQVILKMSTWKDEVENYLALQSSTTPPQHCNLLCLKSEGPTPETRNIQNHTFKDDRDLVFLMNTISTVSMQTLCLPGETLRKHGPSVSWDDNMDYVVNAFNCPVLPDECKFVFSRPRPGHWPDQSLLDEARACGTFVVPQCYSDSPKEPQKVKIVGPMTDDNMVTESVGSLLEWRYSTSRMERLFVFDWSIQQLKVYILLKLIRITFLKPLFGDRLSTFHMKTTMMYTVENYPQDIWRDDNIIQCVTYCLNTLLRWSQLRFCPHFTTENVNLFTGKIHKHEIPRLVKKLSELISSNIQCVFEIKIENIGEHLLNRIKAFQCSLPSSVHNNCDCEIAIRMAHAYSSEYFEIFLQTLQDLDQMTYIDAIQAVRRYTCLLQKWLEVGDDRHIEAAKVIHPMITCTGASMRASRCIKLDRHISKQITTLYSFSNTRSSIPSRLKYASMLYCSGQFEAAAECLFACELILGKMPVWQMSLVLRREYISPVKDLHSQVVMLSNENIFHSIFVTSVVFSRHELHCVPGFLIYDMFRTMTIDDKQDRHLYQDIWMDLAVIDPLPFMYYLQFLTYHALGCSDQMEDSLNKLLEYVHNSVQKYACHVDVAINLLGHCLEKLGIYDVAWQFYKSSLYLYHPNNAAVWHMCRLVHREVIGDIAN
ncbi:uncharacterized protein LOC128219262 [Mya arenaria]|uniref:uncharacterized protein LOC128219262 n=1 Tax=Mya arenaria TaxID=6604 RepID=UPI0022E32287|nr:uncharacterized protein LOC128219262 [Mya arenaria]